MRTLIKEIRGPNLHNIQPERELKQVDSISENDVVGVVVVEPKHPREGGKQAYEVNVEAVSVRTSCAMANVILPQATRTAKKPTTKSNGLTTTGSSEGHAGPTS